MFYGKSEPTMFDSIQIVCAYLIIQMTLVWIAYRITKNPSIVDMTWSLGLMVAGLIYLSSNFTLRNGVLASLLIIWALRLAGYLWYTRIRLGHIDKRYENLSAEWTTYKSFKFFCNYQLQGIFILILSSVFYFSSQVTQINLSIVEYCACLLIMLGVCGESMADYQLQKHKSQQVGQVCNTGLWHYSRHPNYFFDWLSWCGFAVFALPAQYGWIGLISPLFLYIIFNYITGPLTEKNSLQSRGQQFINYQQQTNMFFPWFKR
jgi:steroid 5-alpha reductase family enzyme